MKIIYKEFFGISGSVKYFVYSISGLILISKILG